MKIVSMGDPTTFGPVVYRLSFAEAIDRELLCPYQVVVMPVTDREVRELIEKHRPVTTDGGDTRIDAYGLATQIACLRAMREYGCRRMVVFHPLIDRSRAFSQQFNQALELLPAEECPDGAVWAAHVDGGRMPRSKRKGLIAEFSQQDEVFRLLSNVKILSEGVNFPGIDAVTMIDTKRGPASVIQIVGRAVRRSPGKEVGTIVLPVLVGEGEDPKQALARSEHRPIMDLLAALRAADPDLERSVNELRVEVDPNTGEPPAKRRFILNIPVEVGPEFAEAVNVMLVDALAPAQPGERAVVTQTASARSETITSSPSPSPTLRVATRSRAFRRCATQPTPVRRGGTSQTGLRGSATPTRSGAGGNTSCASGTTSPNTRRARSRMQSPGSLSRRYAGRTCEGRCGA